MSTKTLLLLGYSISDPNFIAIHEMVKYYLGENKRKIYFVTFNLTQDMEDYWSSYGFYPINLTGENKEVEFLNWMKKLYNKI